MKSSFAVCLYLSFFIIRIFITEATPVYRYHNCSNTALFTPNSTYRSNLDTLLFSLSSNATSNTDGFANATAGQNPPDQAYGLFLCHRDVSTATCSDCVATGKRDILQKCPNQRVSVIWYDECMLRYSNEPVFSVMEEEPVFFVIEGDPVLTTYSNGNFSNPAMSSQLLGDAIKNFDWTTSGTRLGNGRVRTASEMVQMMAQCTPDLTRGECNTCLRSVIPRVPLERPRVRIFTPSCNVRFEIYNEATALGPPPPPPAPAGKSNKSGKNNKSAVITIGISISVGAVMVIFLTRGFLRRKGKKTYEVVNDKSGANELTTMESLQFDLATIQAATNDFSPESKLGEGGFGEVFQGILPNGQQIAVKRLSQSSRQGDEELKNEVLLLAKLQHRNLVRLLGFCLEGDEKLLVYEFVPNKSLDYFLFDPQKRGQLDWPLCYKIVSGIARGMLYLHEDSHLRIIHRDLKCSNILLDSEINPKISDFGMARIFGGDQTQANTKKIVGTFGYMSPEYAMHGKFSVKSDVYSFGVLLLEIICGKKNKIHCQLKGGEYLASYVWNQWREGLALEVVDPAIMDSCSGDQVLRCLHICLLCIQEDPATRPTMTIIVLMLSSNCVTLPSPRHPAFFVQSRSQGLSIPMRELESVESANRTTPSSINGMSITELYPR